MGCVEEDDRTVSTGSGSQEKAEAESCRESRNRRRHEEALGCGESGETSSKEGTSEEEDVIGTEGCTGGESGESTSGQGSKAGGTSVIEHSERQSDQRLPAAQHCWFGRRRFDTGEQPCSVERSEDCALGEER